MTEYINAIVFTNLDSKVHNTPKQFAAKFPVMPQVGHIVKWDGRRCHIVNIAWILNDQGIMELQVEINK